ncbi:MAG: polysaccharide biosynthesis protein [Desulfatitalea sp.]|nr:polysaccharide biosynthesis protein [Desulfatitalea sp.]NNK02677.1 polysaccharide biosynthesis protein [Desulfatitalea sp.]
MRQSDLLSSMAIHDKLSKVIALLLPYRLLINVAVHALLFALSYAYSILLINGLVADGTALGIFYNSVLPLILLRLLVFYWHDLYQGLWRYVSFEDMINIIRAVVISSLLFYCVGLVWERAGVAEELYILDMTFSIMCTGGIRFLMRSFRERFYHHRPVEAVKRVLLVGPLDKIQPVLKEFVGDPQGNFLPMAVVDPLKSGDTSLTRVCDVPVISIEQVLAGNRKYSEVDSVIFCWPEGHRRQVDAVVERLKPLAVPFKTIPHIDDILKGRVSINDVREVEIEDLLERPPVQIEMNKISAYLKGKTVLVTGGGGSIGSEICRQVAGFEPRKLVVVERSENSLYDLLLEFRRDFPKTDLSASISSVNDAQGLKALMSEHRVDVVFHAAAYKHVPLMEPAPVESAYNNIEGTFNVAGAAVAAGVKRFVMISTDKAVNPANVMGVTKRIAEMVVQSSNGGATRFMTVRFGNVLGSAGSVIPIFKRQIQDGDAVTVTHPDIERFFMTIPEAVQLVLQAGCMGSGGEIYVLDMGRPVRILHLAERLITLSGKRPYEDVDIVFTGLRPGEKMFEELFNDAEQLQPTSHPRIRTAVSMPVDKARLESQLAQIKQLIRGKQGKALLARFHELVPGYHCPADQAETTLVACGPGHARVDALADTVSPVALHPVAHSGK